MHQVQIDCECCCLTYEQGLVFDGLSEEAREAFATIADEALHAVAMAVARLAIVKSMDKAELILDSLNQCIAILHEACNQADADEDGTAVLEDKPVPYGMYL